MDIIYHPEKTRSRRDMGWIKLFQSFNPSLPPSPDRKHFGVMIILDNGIIAPGGKGFGMHPHENMEILSVVISGEMVHSDTYGNQGVNVANAIQLISAGTGIQHSEYNHSPDMPIDNLQIWFLPKVLDIKPKYQTMISRPEDRKSKLQLLTSPKGDENSLVINQDVWVWRGTFDRDQEITYQKQSKNNIVYLFVIEGEAVSSKRNLSRRDGLGIADQETSEVKMIFNEPTDILIIDVPKTN